MQEADRLREGICGGGSSPRLPAGHRLWEGTQQEEAPLVPRDNVLSLQRLPMPVPHGMTPGAWEGTLGERLQRMGGCS